MAMKKSTLEALIEWNDAKAFYLALACLVFFTSIGTVGLVVIAIQHGATLPTGVFG